jgi:hypothetical protein
LPISVQTIPFDALTLACVVCWLLWIDSIDLIIVIGANRASRYVGSRKDGLSEAKVFSL